MTVSYPENSRSRNKQMKHQCHFSQRQKGAIPVEGRQLELATTSSIRASMKSKIHWGCPATQGRHSQCNIHRLVFDENNHERPPFSLNFFCGENIKLDRSLLVILIPHLVILILVIFCITFLTPCEAKNRFASGILALLSACLGHILPTPKQWLSA